ncbi:hypothetical protein MCHIJ_30410 [Mycolicibacterium chitae]|uniref:Uncharacterized protein n=1 Tax=Mycolicibacterium chitae TaxID=1792 RepID=A0A3S4S8C1_MYCCI|nr:hypothetical protein [Mycolicibacterium chitae]MCV7108917.1 hypothetical protein [Mycolicibacterium chitae]BBZ03604.1 hypothetical protein MCHIJ_30410 [Mycolicibacterium chitae]VEG47259.1 Uncharacterised protein [Mycolicibacterium chitae]
MSQARFTVGYNDDGIVIQIATTTATAPIVLRPSDALDLFHALGAAIQDFDAHRQLVAEVNAIDTGDNDGHQG